MLKRKSGARQPRFNTGMLQRFNQAGESVFIRVHPW